MLANPSAKGRRDVRILRVAHAERARDSLPDGISAEVARISQQENRDPTDALKTLLDGTNEEVTGFGKIIRGLLAGTPATPPA